MIQIDQDLRNRERFAKMCKESVWLKWKDDHLTGLRERNKIIGGK